ncbi:MAG: hypothetical protein IT453_06885 [Planctomycetes bacterium]|nr:hypothetical protein [Planctomycetota bacterium]
MLALLLWLAAQAVQLEAPVGLTARVGDVVLAGSELEVAPLAKDSPLVVRITRVAPHGDAFCYDFELVGLEAGTYELAPYLRRKDASPVGELAAPKLVVRSSLADGQVLPHHPPAGPMVRFGGYTALLWTAGALWLVGLVAILFAGRRRRAREHAEQRPKTLAERLEPLVRSALAGELGRSERAALELGLVAYWTRRLGWEAERPDHVLPKLRAHPEAGPLLVGLEQWLHAPGKPTVDVEALLAPYRNLPADALTLEPAGASRG